MAEATPRKANWLLILLLGLSLVAIQGYNIVSNTEEISVALTALHYFGVAFGLILIVFALVLRTMSAAE